MPILDAPYNPPRWLRNAHVNTMWPVLFRKMDTLQAERVRLATPDDDFVDIDIMRSPHETAPKDGPRRAAILSHGLEGSVRRKYMQGMARVLLEAGFDVVGRHFRGCSGEPARHPTHYHMGDTDDLHLVVSHCAAQWDSLALVGFSMGGAQTLKYLGENPARLPPQVKAGVGISVPCDLLSSAPQLSAPSCAVYMCYFMRTMKPKMRYHAARWADFPSTAGLDQVRTFDEFDERFTAPLNGFASARDYWSRSSCLRHLPHIPVPTLIINAKDDPFLTPSCIPYDEARHSALLHVMAPRHGGHVGFVSAGQYYWTEEKTAEFLRGVAM